MVDDDPYVYPGTDILRNCLGIREATDLAEQEAALSSIRIAQLERRFIPGDYDLTHLRTTHSYIFGEVYPWAGALRTVRIAKGADLFALPEHIGPYLTTLFADLAREDRLQDLEREQFMERLTHTDAGSLPNCYRARIESADIPRSRAKSSNGRYSLEGCESWLGRAGFGVTLRTLAYAACWGSQSHEVGVPYTSVQFRTGLLGFVA
ncbi:MAG: Fic/DOC family protein [Solirubrobacteraceae bacterium]